MSQTTAHRDNSYLIALWLALLWMLALLLGGCTSFPAWGAWSESPSAGQLEAARQGPVLRYVYYPDYEVYYNATLDQFIYQTPGGWVARSTPPDNVTETTLEVSPAVEISLPGEPSAHHATVAQAHPGRAGIPPQRR